MGNRAGYFLIYRKLFDNDIAMNPLLIALWVRFIADAAWEDKTVYFNSTTVQIKRGELVTSLTKLAHWLGVSRTTVTYYANRLQTMQQINIRKTNKYIVVSIKNYDKYQPSLQQNDVSPVQPTDTKNKYNKDKEYIYTGESLNLLQLTKQQKTTLQKKYPYIDVDYEIQKFVLWQKSEGKQFANTLARFEKWLVTAEQWSDKKTNQLTDDPLFKRLLPVYHAHVGQEWELKNRLIDKLNDKFPLPKYQKEWNEAKSILKELPDNSKSIAEELNH